MTPFTQDNPLIVQSDHTVFLDVASPLFEEAREQLSRFAELEKAPEHLHTYRITPLSLWNASASGMTAREMVHVIERYSKFTPPPKVTHTLQELASRWGRLKLTLHQGGLILQVQPGDHALLSQLQKHPKLRGLLGSPASAEACTVPLENRGHIKQVLLGLGWPVDDQAGYHNGQALSFTMNPGFQARPYQQQAIEAFDGQGQGGAGVITLPPGAGKTTVGILAMQLYQQKTLILTTSSTSVEQWKREILQKTNLQATDIETYTSRSKKIAPVTITTYQMLTAKTRGATRGSTLRTDFPHLGIFMAEDWGLLIYDEVHALPAPVFRVTSEVQSKRRLGLTATLIREDGREGDVFSLIGPKKYHRAWKDIEQQGWIAAAECTEVRVPLDPAWIPALGEASERDKHRLAAENPNKLRVLQQILKHHKGQPTLVIGQYIDQLQKISVALQAPLLYGDTPQHEREAIYQQFREGQHPVLVVSKIANFALDLPDAQLLIQVSGTFGSRQEEAQRLGRVLRPKPGGKPAHFYTLVTGSTQEEEFAHNRQLFLCEQGYQYRITTSAEFQGTPQP